MKRLQEEKFVRIALDEEQNRMYVNWMGDQTMLTVRAGCEAMLEVAKATKANAVFNDNREVTSSWSDAAEWVGTSWFPKMKQAGVLYFAWVYSPNVFSRLSTDTSVSFSKQGPETALFDNAEEAENWLAIKTGLLKDGE